MKDSIENVDRLAHLNKEGFEQMLQEVKAQEAVLDTDLETYMDQVVPLKRNLQEDRNTLEDLKGRLDRMSRTRTWTPSPSKAHGAARLHQRCLRPQQTWWQGGTATQETLGR